MKNKSGFKPPAGQAAPDKYLRCDKCNTGPVDYGEQPVGTLMIREFIQLWGEKDNPSVTIGSVVRCGNPDCDKTPVIKLYRVAKALDIEPNMVYRLVRACKGSLGFRLHELYSGEMDREPVPPALAEAFRPKFGTLAEEQKAAPTLFEQPAPQEVSL